MKKILFSVWEMTERYLIPPRIACLDALLTLNNSLHI